MVTRGLMMRLGLVLLFIGLGVYAAAAEVVVDRFGIKELYPSALQGRSWAAVWDNGLERKLTSGDRDPDDAEFIMRGDGTAVIDGHGVVRIGGDCPRLYVYDEPRQKKWCNVEVTLYFRRIKEMPGELSYRGFAVGVRSEHQDAESKIMMNDGRLKSPAHGAGYYGKMLYDGRVVFMKELIHNPSCGYSDNKPLEGDRHFWNTPDRSLPADSWIGMKFVVRNLPDHKVKLELYRDLSDGKNGGQWQKQIEYIDQGGWSSSRLTAAMIAKATLPGKKPIAVDEILTGPGTSVFIRSDGIVAADCKKFSIREILPENIRQEK